MGKKRNNLKKKYQFEEVQKFSENETLQNHSLISNSKKYDEAMRNFLTKLDCTLGWSDGF